MSSMPQYYSNDNTPQQNNREPHLLSSSYIQPELNSQAQHFSNMSENGYQTTTDQFVMHTHSSSLGQTPVPMSEPPPYDEFVEYNWPTEIATNLALPPDDFTTELFNPQDAQFIFNDFLGNLDNENFIFNPSLPVNMPLYPNSTSDNNDSSSSPSIVDNVYSILPPGQMSPSSPSTADLLNRNQFPSANSTSLSPRTSNITLSSSPPLPPSNNVNSHNNDGGDDVSSDGGKADGSSTPTVPSKRKQENDDDRNRRRASIPRLNPINTKLSMTQSNNSNGSKPLSPSMQLSNLSIDNSNNNNSNNSSSNNNNGGSSSNNNNNNISNNNHNHNNYDDSQCNTPTSSNNSSPRSPNREIINPKNEDEELATGTSSTNNLSNIDDQNEGFSPPEIKTEESLSSSSSSSSKQTPQKSSRKPYKELLTEEEKRANHIASEQKRRNTIRAGFKELTDIIPTLKNVNNSKSTILFKAVDYIKYLERRNRNLKERAGLLEMRVEMEMRQGKRFHHHHHPHGNPFGPNTMGFGHQRVVPMPMSYGVIPNGMTAIPIGPSGHPPQRQPPHVMTPHHQIYFVPSNENPSIIPAGSVVSPTNNIYNRGSSAMGMQIQQQQNHHHPQQDNVPGMNIPTIASDDDGNNGVDIDGDSSMLGMNGNPSVRVGVKC